LAQLRWILAALGAVAIAAIWWWSTRRSGQAPGNSELRESTVVPLQTLTAASDDRPDAHDHTEPRERAGARQERSISPLEPLSIRTADFETVVELSMTAHPEPEHEAVGQVDYMAVDPHPSLDVDVDHRGGGEPGPAAPQAASPEAGAPQAASPEAAAPEAAAPQTPSPPESDPPAANVSERQKIVTLRVCAVGEERWSGRDLMSALEGHGLAYGRYQVYHRKHADGQSIFYVASLIEPGTFDAGRMPVEEFRGVSMFAVLPGPLEPLQAVDALLSTARDLARELSGTVQDAKGMPFSPQRIATLREEVAEFRPATRGPAA
jgi:cell division protein ZipA